VIRILLPLLLLAPLFGAAEGAASPQLLGNPDFEHGGHVASDWYENTWDGAVADCTASDDPVHGGDRAQRIQVSDLGAGGTLFAQEYDFDAGHAYEASIWIRADTEMQAVFLLQSRDPDYEAGARRTVQLGPEWQHVVIRGGFGDDDDETPEITEGRVAVSIESPGTLYLDDAELYDVTGDVLSDPVVNLEPIPHQYFGMHVNKLGVHETWPPVGFGTLRLWDTGTNWARIEPEPGMLADPAGWEGPARRIERYVTYAEEHDPEARVIYTLGMTPEWAGPDRTLPPGDRDDWRRYVRAVAERFRGRITHWEIWNEANISRFWQGSMDELVELTRIASEELRATDPGNVVIAPDFTTVNRFEEFLASGGGEYVDVLAFHEYPSLRPEDSVPLIVGYRDAAAAHGMGDAPLWNTEGAVAYDLGMVLDDDTASGATARALIVQWASGVENFNWYAWDIYEDRSRRFVALSESETPDDYAGITPAGIAYRQTAEWLTGAHMVGGAVSGPLWSIELERTGAAAAWIVWSTSDTETLTLPTTWDGARVHHLSGETTEAPGPNMTVGPMPVLVEPVAEGATDAIELPVITVADAPTGDEPSGRTMPVVAIIAVVAAAVLSGTALVTVRRRRSARS